MTPAIDVFEELHDLMHLYRGRMMAACLAVSDLTFNETRVLMRIGKHPGLTQKDLVAHSHTDKAQMARLLSQLQDQGWLARTASEQDKRVRCLRLSAKGQSLFQALKRQREAVAQDVLHDMPREAQAQLLQLLVQARTSARAQPKPADTVDATDVGCDA